MLGAWRTCAREPAGAISPQQVLAFPPRYRAGPSEGSRQARGRAVWGAPLRASSKQIFPQQRHGRAERGSRPGKVPVWPSDQPSAWLERLPWRRIAGRGRPALRTPMIAAAAPPIAHSGRPARGNVRSVPCGVPLSGRGGTALAIVETCHGEDTADMIEILLTAGRAARYGVRHGGSPAPAANHGGFRGV